MTVKIFVGNIASGTDATQMRELFERYGVVTECDVLGGYGFVHMETEEVANDAIKALSGYNLNGSRLNIELSTAATQGRARLAARNTATVKIFVGNLSKSTTDERLRELFETYGGVAEADVLGGFGFVHMSNEPEAFKAIKALNGFVLDGSRINVELSTGGTQGKSKERDPYSSRSFTSGSRSRGANVRYDPYSYAPTHSRRSLESHESHVYQGQASRGSSDSFARDLLELYIKNRSAFDAYANDPVVRKSLNLPQSEEAGFYRGHGHSSASAPREYYERRRLSDLSSSGDPYASPSDYAAYDSMVSAAAGRSWPGSSSSSSSAAALLSSYGGTSAGPNLPSSASAKGKGHLYTSFE